MKSSFASQLCELSKVCDNNVFYLRLSIPWRTG